MTTEEDGARTPTGNPTDSLAASATEQQRAPQAGCDLCDDQGPLFMRARCHLTAPLQVTLDGDVLILRCYVPECSREVARYPVVRSPLSVAAPHLFAALTRIANSREECGCDHQDANCCNLVGVFCARCIAAVAIAKAEGR